MYAYRLRMAALAAVAAGGLAACTTPYGYGGVSVGSGYYGSNYGYGSDYGYGYGYGGGYPGYGYGNGAGFPGYGLGYAPYWGWYDNFYYPGTGYYVYDRYRRPHRWSDAQRRYWSQRRDHASRSGNDGHRVVIRDNWNDFSRTRPAVRPSRAVRSVDRPARVEGNARPVRAERSVRPQSVERRAVRSERASKASVREDRRSEARATRDEERASRSNGRGRGNRND